MPPLYFIRHGETDWNKQGLIQGWTDTELNERGHAQARALGAALAAIPGLATEFRFIVSPLTRTRQTMEHIAGALSLDGSKVDIDPAVRELGFGVWEGKPIWQLKDSPLYPADAESRYFWRPEGGESYEDGNSRIEGWFGAIDGPTVVVAHGAIGRCLIGYTADLGPAEVVALKTPQGCYWKLENGQADWFDVNGDQA